MAWLHVGVKITQIDELLFEASLMLHKFLPDDTIPVPSNPTVACNVFDKIGMDKQQRLHDSLMLHKFLPDDTIPVSSNPTVASNVGEVTVLAR